MDVPAAQQIDAIIRMHDDWKGEMLSRLRNVILSSDPDVIEAVKWKKPSKPEGVAVWMYDGNVCMADILKDAVRLTFPLGAFVPDPQKLFNTRLDSKSVRAIDYFEGETIDEAALKQLFHAAAQENEVRSLQRKSK